MTYSSPAVILDRGSDSENDGKDNSEGDSRKGPSMLFIGTTKGKLLALRAFNGDKLWEFQTQGVIHSSPAVLLNGNKSRVFVGSSDGALHALNLAGKQKWQFQTGDAIFSSPTVGQIKNSGESEKGDKNKKDKSDENNSKDKGDKGDESVKWDNAVIIGSNDGKLYCLRAFPDDNKPKPVWVTSLHNAILGKPALDEDHDEIYVGTQDCTLFLISAKDGKILDKLKVDGPMRSSPAIKTIDEGPKKDKDAGTLVFFGAGHKFYMVQSNGGHLHLKFSKNIGKLVVSSPALAGKWGNGDLSPEASAQGYGKDGKDSGDGHKDGDKVESDRHDSGNGDSKDGEGDNRGENSNNLVLIGSDDGKVYVFKVNPEKVSAKLETTFDTGGKIFSSVAATEDYFAVGSDSHKILTVRLEDLFKAKNPTAAWNFMTGASVESSPALSGNSLYVASDDGKLYAFQQTHPGKAVQFELTAPSPVEAAQEFPLGVSARDGNGNLASGYRGTAKISGLDPNNQNLDLNSLTFGKMEQGSGVVELTLNTVGDWTLTALDSVHSIMGTAQVAVTALAGLLSPSNGELVNQIVEITGNQSSLNEVEWSPAGAGQWTALTPATSSEQAAIRHLVAKWDTSGLVPGPYDLRLVQITGEVEIGRITVIVGLPNYEKTLSVSKPNALTDVDLGRGKLFAVDQQNNHVDLFNGSDSPLGALGNIGNRTGELNSPNKAAVSSDGTLFVADTGNKRVEVFPDGDDSYSFTLGQGQLNNPQAVEVRGSVVYVLDGNLVDRFTLGGQFISLNTAQGLGPYTDLAVDDQGRLFLTNSGQQDVEIYNVDGIFLRAFDGKGKHSGVAETTWIPSSVAFVDDGPLANNGGRLYVTDSANHKVQKFGLDGNHLMTFGGFGGAHGQFDQPMGSASNGQGSIYVADTGNQRLEKFNQPALVFVPSPTPGAILLVNLTASPDVFDPAVFSTNLIYTMSQPANVLLTITGSSGTVFQQNYVAGSFGGMQGLNQVVWNGFLGGTPLPNGNYTETLQASANGQQTTSQVIVRIQSGAVVPTATPTAVSTSTPTFTPTNTFTPTPTSTPLPPLQMTNLDIHPDTMDVATNPKVVTGTFTLNIPASVQIVVKSRTTAQVFETLNMIGVIGNNNFTLNNFNPALVADGYTVFVTAIAGSQTATLPDDFDVTSGGGGKAAPGKHLGP